MHEGCAQKGRPSRGGGDAGDDLNVNCVGQAHVLGELEHEACHAVDARVARAHKGHGRPARRALKGCPTALNFAAHAAYEQLFFGKGIAHKVDVGRVSRDDLAFFECRAGALCEVGSRTGSQAHHVELRHGRFLPSYRS